MGRRFEIGLAVASALHVALIASVRSPRPAPLAPSPVEVPIEIVTDEAQAAPPPPATSPTATSPAAAAQPPSPDRLPLPAPQRAAANAASPSSAPPSGEIPASDPVIAAPGTSAWNGWSLAFRDPSAVSAPPGGPPIRLRPSRDVEPPPLSPPPASTTGGVAEALHAHDVALGLGAGGPVIGAAEEATSSSRAPVNGVAVLIATFGPGGVVADVRVVDSNGDRTAWDEVATQLAEAMRSRHVRVPPGARGVEVTVRIESRWENHDGSDAEPYKVCVLGLPCNAGPRRRTLTVGPLGVAGPIDPTSAAPPQRVVHARVVSERTM